MEADDLWERCDVSFWPSLFVAWHKYLYFIKPPPSALTGHHFSPDSWTMRFYAKSPANIKEKFEWAIYFSAARTKVGASMRDH